MTRLGGSVKRIQAAVSGHCVPVSRRPHGATSRGIQLTSWCLARRYGQALALADGWLVLQELVWRGLSMMKSARDIAGHYPPPEARVRRR